MTNFIACLCSGPRGRGEALCDFCKKRDIMHCEDCLAYFPRGYNHVCPPWLKALVTKKKQEDEQKRNQESKA